MPAGGVVQNFKGYLQMNRGAGTVTSFAPLSQFWQIPYAQLSPFNLFGYAYPPMVNASAFPSLRYQGKKRPGFRVSALAKPNWWTHEFLGALLLNLSDQGSGTAASPLSRQCSDRWNAQMFDGLTTREWNWARCGSVRMGIAAGSPIAIDLDFLARWGYDDQVAYQAGTPRDCPYGTTLPDLEVIGAQPTWPSISAASAGLLESVVDYDFRSDSLAPGGGSGTWTAQQVRSCVITLIRGQNYLDYSDGQRYAKDIQSGALSGVVSLEVNPDSFVIPAGTDPISLSCRFGVNQGANSGTISPRFILTMLLSLDSIEVPQNVGLGTLVLNYTLMDVSAGGNPVTITKY